MKQGFLASASPLTKLIFLFIIAFACFGIIFIIGTIVGLVLFDINIFELSAVLEDLYNPNNVSILKYFQILQTIGLFVIPPFILAYFINRNPKSYLNFNKKSSLEIYIIAGLAMLLALPLINFFADINSKMNLPESLSGIENWMRDKEVTAEELTKIFVHAENFSGFVLNLFMIAILPAIGEELIFRGVIQKLFSESFNNVHWGVIIASILFSAFHLQFFGFIPRMLLGVFLGYLFVWSKNIWIPIFAHFVNNGAAVTAYYFLDEETVTKNLEEVGATNETAIYTIVSVIVVGFLIYLFRKKVAEENLIKTN